VADETKRRGRPRSEHARLAVLAAAAELLLDFGLDAVSMDQIAEHACVSKATIYRWWPSKPMLALDALLAEWEAARPQGRDTGTLRGDLISLIRPWVRRLESRPYAGVIASLITEAHSNPAFAREWRERFVAVRRDPALRLLQRAIERGEIPRNTDVDLVLDLIYGPLYHRLFHGHAPLNERIAVKVVDAALAGILAPAPR